MNKAKYVITDDEVYCRIPAPQYGENIYRTEIIITREAFVECYKRWILKDQEIARVTSGNSDYPYAVERIDE